MRDLLSETTLSPKDFIYPIFIEEGENIKTPVQSMPGIFRYSLDMLPPLLEEIGESGISGALVFGKIGRAHV